jgi:hypothetical protein
VPFGLICFASFPKFSDSSSVTLSNDAGYQGSGFRDFSASLRFNDAFFGFIS